MGEHCLHTAGVTGSNPVSPTIFISTGCSIADSCPCDNPWKNHGAYVSCVAHTSEDFVAARLITDSDKDNNVSTAAESDCGAKK